VGTIASQINAYLIDAPMIFIDRRSEPLCKVSEMILGNIPRDGGNFFIDQEERRTLIKADPKLKEIIRQFWGAHEFLNNIPRYCIWLDNVPVSTYNHSKPILERISKVKTFRKNSQREATNRQADFPTLFSEIRQPKSNYILIPLHTSERRKYIPIGFVSKNIICGNSNSMIPKASLYEFGVITSTMHMAWMRYICGYLGTSYRYSGTIVYNNFPWCTPTDKQKTAIEAAAQGVLDARKLHSDLTLAELYNDLTMPVALTKAHQKLDKAVEKAYGREFDDDTQRVAYLFELYQTLSGELFKEEKKRGKGRKV
jgi:hypothetical protein